MNSDVTVFEGVHPDGPPVSHSRGSIVPVWLDRMALSEPVFQLVIHPFKKVRAIHSYLQGRCPPKLKSRTYFLNSSKNPSSIAKV